MITALIVIGSTLGYFAIGRVVAVHRLPGLWIRANQIWRDGDPQLLDATHEKHWSDIGLKATYGQVIAFQEQLRRRYVQRRFLLTMAAWPLVPLFSTGVAVDADPLVEVRRREAAEAETARLEEELLEARRTG